MQAATATIEASPKKLRSGEWGALVQSDQVRRGDSICITSKSGKSWQATVAKIIWSGQGKAIVATESQRRGRQRDGLDEARRCGWDGVVGSDSYYSSGAFDELDM